MTVPNNPLARFHRQMLLSGIGETGQNRLGASHVLLVGCGALGTVIAELLVRAGVGELTIVDRDVVELTNLQRQILFDETDAACGTPKAGAAEARLLAINRTVTIHSHVDDFNATNAERYVTGCHIILDGLDNYHTRYLLNDVAVKHNLPYIHGGAVATSGTAMTIIPDCTPCLRCVFPEPPPAGTSVTCDTAGVLGPLVMMIAAHQATEAIKVLTGNTDAVDRSLVSIDPWRNRIHRTDLSTARDPQCPCCGQRHWTFLHGEGTSSAVTLCGRNAVQINPPANGGATMELCAIKHRLGAHGTFSHNEHLLRGCFVEERGEHGEPIELTLFPNGRAIIKGTDRLDRARSIYAKYLGS